MLSKQQQQLVVEHDRLAMYFANRWRRWGIDIEDLEQVARIGLVIAAAYFEPGRASFVSFAGRSIQRELAHFILDNAFVVRQCKNPKARRRIFDALTGRSDSDEAKSIRAARERGSAVSCDLADNRPSPEEALLAAELGQAVRTIRFTDRERRIIECRAMADKRMPLQALGALYGVSREAIRQTETKALAKASMALREYA